jgi:hypothetical protein
MKENADRPGSYNLAVLLNKQSLNSGDSLKINVFFTGYGKIGLSKVYINLSELIFDANSNFSSSLSHENNLFQWGGQISKTNLDHGMVINMSGGFSWHHNDTTIKYGLYLDHDSRPDNIAIITEDYINNAPLTFNLKLKNDAKPGIYTMGLYYTYFNGIEWKGTTTEVEIKVNSFFEEHSDGFTILGFLIGIISIIPVFDWIINFYRKKFASKKTVKKPAVKS